MPRRMLLCLFIVACRPASPAAEAPTPAVTTPAPPTPVAPTPTSPTPAQAEAGPEASADADCDVEAFVVDPDPAGLNVRDEPSARARIVGNVARNEDGTVLEVVGARNGWLRVRRALPVDGEPYDLSGWVSGRMVETSIRCPDESPGPDCTVALRAAPGEGAAELRRLPVDARVKVLGCRGRWVQAQPVDAPRDQQTQAWLAPDAQCPNPVTSCP